MYLLYLDESGTHAAAEVFVLAGMAIHEHDVYRFQRQLHRQVAGALRPLQLDPTDFEIHANELRASDEHLQARPAAKGRKAKPASPWLAANANVRRTLLTNSFRTLATFTETDPRFRFSLFGAVVDSRYANREERAYELVLNKFDEMLERTFHKTGTRERGLVLHDVRQKEERGIQTWTAQWREHAGNIGRIHNIVDVPVFLDSRASRAIQGADLVSYALWRYYSNVREDRYIAHLWPRFDTAADRMHGLIHVTKDFKNPGCSCPPCFSRRSG